MKVKNEKAKYAMVLSMILITFLAVISSSKIVLSQSTLRVASIADCKGSVKVRRSGGEKSYAAVDNMSILKGDTIITGKNSSVNLLIDTDKIVSISQCSQLTISNLVISDIKSHTGRTLLNLRSGSVYVNIKNKLTNDSSFEIKTPTAIMGVRGTKFYVAMNDVEVLTGTVMTTIPLSIKKNDGTIEKTFVQIPLTKDEQLTLPNSLVPVSDENKPLVAQVKLQNMPSTILEAIKQDVSGIDVNLLKDIDKVIEEKKSEESKQKDDDFNNGSNNKNISVIKENSSKENKPEESKQTDNSVNNSSKENKPEENKQTDNSVNNSSKENKPEENKQTDNSVNNSSKENKPEESNQTNNSVNNSGTEDAKVPTVQENKPQEKNQTNNTDKPTTKESSKDKK